MKKRLIFIGLFIVSALLLPTFMSMCESKIEQETEDFELETPIIEENTDEDKEENIKKAAATIIEMVKNRDKKGISEIISYPLEREYPIPPIKDKTEFVERFNDIFDSKLINKIENIQLENCSSFGWRGIFFTEKKDNYEHLFLGFDIDSVGNPHIYSIEHSETEAKKVKTLIELERKELHNSLKSFIYPVVLMETPTQLIRIDRIENKKTVVENEEREIGYRYASWKNGSSISDKPDLILTNGIQFVEGSMCNTYYQFKNGNDEYSFQVGMWGNPQYIDDSDIKVVYWSERNKLK